jgi:5-methylthioadenosine/S-adenosylhomocysteine deaminase
MKFTSLIHRAARADASLLGAAEVLRMATVGGATALGTGGGRIAPGATADLTVVGLDDFAFVPRDIGDAGQLAAHLVYSCRGSNVSVVVVNGEVVVKDGTLVRVEEQAIRENANRCFGRIVERVSSC